MKQYTLTLNGPELDLLVRALGNAFFDEIMPEHIRNATQRQEDVAAKIISLLHDLREDQSSYMEPPPPDVIAKAISPTQKFLGNHSRSGPGWNYQTSGSRGEIKWEL
jgi:hypothetical protein